MNLPNVLQLEHLKRTYVCEFSQAVQMLHWTFGTILNLVEYDLAELVPKLLGIHIPILLLTKNCKIVLAKRN